MGEPLTAYDVAQIRAAVWLTYALGAILIAAWVLAMPGKNGRRRWTNLRQRYFPVNPLPPAYVKQPANDAPAQLNIPYPTVDTDADTDADIAPGMVMLAENDLQQRLEAAREQGMAEAFGMLLGAGYLATAVEAGRVTEAKKLVFGTSGRRLSRVKPIIDAAAEKHRPMVEPQRTPLVGRPIPPGVEFRDEDLRVEVAP